MPNRYKPNCATCVLSKSDLGVRKRIRYAAYKREQGDETLQDIANEIGVSQASIYNHVKKHMEDISDRYKNRNELHVAKKVAEVKAKVQQEAELVLSSEVMEAIEVRPLEIAALDDYIAQAKAMIDKKELKITATTFLQATKIKSDWQLKQQSNKTDFMKAIYAMASGDKAKVKKEIPDVVDTREDGAGNPAGEEQSEDIYRTITGPDTP